MPSPNFSKLSITYFYEQLKNNVAKNGEYQYEKQIFTGGKTHLQKRWLNDSLNRVLNIEG